MNNKNILVTDKVNFIVQIEGKTRTILKIKKGYDKKTVRNIWNMVKFSEFKRYQSSIGPKVSKMSLSADRRFPITNKFEL